jgi:hypothetical protein
MERGIYAASTPDGIETRENFERSVYAGDEAARTPRACGLKLSLKRV